jgi:hypothetical protein
MEMSHQAPSVSTLRFTHNAQMPRFRAGHAAFKTAAILVALITGLSECVALWRARLRLGLSLR